MAGNDLTVLEAVLKADEERTALQAEEKKILSLQKEEHDGHGEAKEGEEEGHDYSERLHEIYERLQQIDASSAPARAATVLSGLQFNEDMQNSPTKDLSGGWRMRVSLAAALFVEPDVLLLDEPTNHLDFPAVEWLTNYLNGYEKTLVVVSHDRDFLNNVCTDMIHIEDQKLKYYKGDYDMFEQVRTEKRKQAKTAYDKQRATIEHNEDFVRRFRANKKLASLAQSRVKLLAGMERLDDVKDDFNFRFRFPEPSPLKKDVLISVDDMAFGYYGDDKESLLFHDVNLKLKNGTVVGVMGANGAGKSTLINLCLSKLEPVHGGVIVNKSASIGFFAQHHMDMLDLDATPIEFPKAQFPEAKHQDVFHKLGQFSLSRECAQQKIRQLSGGEKSRVSFSVLTWHHPHLLVMDEPTNHLDLDTIDGLIEAVKEYKGGAVIISHDQHFLKSVCNEFWAIGGDRTVKAFATLKDAKKFSYTNKRAQTVGLRTEAMVKHIADAAEKASLEQKSNGVAKSNGVKEISSRKKKKEKKALAFDLEEDILHLVEKALAQQKTPAQMHRMLQSSSPDPNTILVAKQFGDRLFSDYFTKSSFEDDGGLEAWAPLLKHMTPDEHVNNQAILLFAAQSTWHASKSKNWKRATKDGALLQLFQSLFDLEIICTEAFEHWRDDTANKARGKGDSLQQVSKWLNSVC